MTADLDRPRLSAVAQPAGPEPRRYPTHDDIVRAIYNDRRANLEQRELLLAIAYALYLAPSEDGKGPLIEARRVLGRQYGAARYDKLVKADIPRYEPPREAGDWGPSAAPGCEAPRLRPYVYRPRQTASAEDAAVPLRPLPPPVVHVPPGYVPPVDYRNAKGICGADSHHKVLEKDPRTGWITAHWFCKRHADHAKRVAEQVRAQNDAAPEPIPNRGGLLSCYFKADWEKVYRHYAGWNWEPPTYGLCADDWPTPGEQMVARGRLRVVVAIDTEESQ